MDMIYADTSGTEIGYLTHCSLDIDIGDTNDFESLFRIFLK